MFKKHRCKYISTTKADDDHEYISTKLGIFKK